MRYIYEQNIDRNSMIIINSVRMYGFRPALFYWMYEAQGYIEV